MVAARLAEQAAQVDPAPVEQPHVTDWSTVLRVPTAEDRSGSRPTPRRCVARRPSRQLVAALRRSGCPCRSAATPPRVAAAGGRRAEPARRDRRGSQPERVARVLRGVRPAARVRGRASTRCSQPGCPTPAADAARAYDVLLEQLDDADPRLPVLARRRRSATGCGDLRHPRDRLQHDDLHDGQVFLASGRAPGPATGATPASAHPFFTRGDARGRIAWGVDDVEDSEDVRPTSRPTSGRTPPTTTTGRPRRCGPARRAAGLGVPRRSNGGTAPASGTTRHATRLQDVPRRATHLARLARRVSSTRNPLVLARRSSGSPARSASAAASRAPRFLPTTMTAGRPAPAAAATSAAARAAPPCRSGSAGWTRSRRRPRRRAPASGRQRDEPRVEAERRGVLGGQQQRALVDVDARDRRQRHGRASASPMTPYPQPRSRNWPCTGGSVSRNSTAVAWSRCPRLNTPEPCEVSVAAPQLGGRTRLPLEGHAGVGGEVVARSCDRLSSRLGPRSAWAASSSSSG